MTRAEAPTEVEGLFGPGSGVWYVDREIMVLLGSGSRALMLQIAHPKIAAAVAEHSRFQSDPIGRLRGTLEAIYTFAFAERSRAEDVVSSITRRHASVRGQTPTGEPYSALDPHLLLWVYATLIDSSLLAYETFIGPLPRHKCDAYYDELAEAGPLWGIQRGKLPPSLADLRAWMTDLISTGEVRVTPQARSLGHYILRPALRWFPAQLMLPLQLSTLWLLPPTLRAGFGYGWGPRRETFMHAVARASRATVPRLPQIMRDLPVARAAERRVQRSGAR